MERLLLTMEEQGIEIPDTSNVKIFVGSMSEQSSMFAHRLVQELRSIGVSAERDHMDRSVKAQLKYANKIRAEYVIVLGDDEIESGKVKLKNMAKGEEITVDATAEAIAKEIE